MRSPTFRFVLTFNFNKDGIGINMMKTSLAEEATLVDRPIIRKASMEHVPSCILFQKYESG